MKIYKYIFFTILFALSITLYTTLFLNNVSFDSGYYPCASFRFDKNNTEKAFEQIALLSEKNNIPIYIPDIYNEDKSLIRCDYYADEKARDIIENEMKIHQGVYRSGLSDRYKYDIRIFPLEEAKGKISFYHNITAAENSEKAKNFVYEFGNIINKTLNDEELCSINIPQVTSFEKFNDKIMIDWSVAIIIMLIITVFETAILRKEAVVSLISGRSIASYIAKVMLTDIAVYSGILALMFTIFYFIGYPMNFLVSCLISFGIVVAGSLLIYLTLYISNIKKTLGGIRQGTRVLYFNYLIKTLAVAASLVFLLDLVSLIKDNQVNSDTEDIISEYLDGYYYCDVENGAQFANKMDESNPKAINFEIYQKHYDDLKPLVLNGHKGENGESFVYANAYAMDYIYSVIPELKDVNSENKLIIAGKKGDENFEEYLRKDKEALEELKQIDPVRAKNIPEPKVFYYESSADILCIGADTNTKTEYFKNPIISISLETGEDLIKKGTSMSFNALKLDKEKTAMLCKEYDLNEKDLALCTIAETFEKQWGVGKAAIASHIALEAVVLFVVMLISISVLKFTFITKAKELCIKKICGHGFIARYCTTFLLSLAMYVPAYIYAIYMDNKETFNANTAVITLFTLAVIAIDLLVSLPYIIKTERANISKVLKGGAL